MSYVILFRQQRHSFMRKFGFSTNCRWVEPKETIRASEAFDLLGFSLCHEAARKIRNTLHYTFILMGIVWLSLPSHASTTIARLPYSQRFRAFLPPIGGFIMSFNNKASIFEWITRILATSNRFRWNRTEWKTICSVTTHQIYNNKIVILNQQILHYACKTHGHTRAMNIN